MKTSGTGRDKRGRFIKGEYGGGPGRPKRATEEEYLTVTFAECPLEAWQVIVKKAVQDAQKGDSKAREWLSRYLLPEKKDGVITAAAGGFVQLTLSSDFCGPVPELADGYGAI